MLRCDRSKFLNYNVFIFLGKKMFLFLKLPNATDPDEMLHYAAFHLGLHCLPKYLFNGIKNERVKNV